MGIGAGVLVVKPRPSDHRLCHVRLARRSAPYPMETSSNSKSHHRPVLPGNRVAVWYSITRVAPSPFRFP